MDSSATILWTSLSLIARLDFIITIEVPVINTNCVDYELTHFAAFDLGWHCMPVTFFRVSELKWVKVSHLRLLTFTTLWANSADYK